MGKVYAVRNGRETGLFYTWADCQKQVVGFSGAKFKSFESELEAKAWLIGDNAVVKDCEAYAYTDGSYNNDTGITGGGGVLEFKGQKYFFAMRTTEKDAEYNDMRNVGGEILAARAALNKAKELGIKSLHIYHDYEGVGAWVKGEWKANKSATQEWAAFAKESGIDLVFTHVYSHTGIKWNEAADEIAKYAVGLAGSEVRLKYPSLQWIKALPEKEQLDMFEAEDEFDLDKVADKELDI